MNKNIPFSLIIFFTFSLSFSQIASYKFENNLNDEIGNYTAFHTKNGVINNQIEFRNEGDGYENVILLDSTQGIFLPKAFNSKLDFSKSIEFIFDFKITNLGSSRGRKEILELSGGGNDNTEGINIWTDKINDNSYKVILNYTDGGYNRGEPNHPGGSRNTIGFFDVNEWVKFRLIIDFENKKWKTILNSESSSGLFDDFYDFEKIKQTILNNHIRIGWLNNATSVHSNFTSSMMFDNFKIFSPRSDGNSNAIKTALIAMKNHVNGDNILSNAQLKNYLSIIQINYFGNFAKVRNEVFDFLNAYESKNIPVFSNSNNSVDFTSLSTETQTLIFLQQSIFDEEYNSELKVIGMSGVKFEAADHFPGKVKEGATRISDASVEIDGNYSYIPGARHLNDTWHAKRPTGYYVPPGELISITIPGNLIDKNIKVKVGVHERDHSNLSTTNRFLRISKDFKLEKEVTKITNPFGGGVYILVPEGANLGSFEINIDGAVKAPYFSSRKGNETSISVWQDELGNQNVPWADIEGDKFMTTIESSHLYTNGSINLTDPTLLMKKWGEVADAFNYVGGRPPERSKAEYIISDSRIPNGGYGTGYPAVYDRRDSNMIPTALLKKDPHKIGGVVILFHEMGHLEWHPTLGKAVESIVHLPAVYLWNKYYNIPLDTAFKHSAFQKLTMDQTTIDWMITDNFRNNKPMECDPTMESNVCHEVRYQHRGHAMYVEIADLFGWEAVHNTHKVFYDEWKLNTQKDWGFMGENTGNYIKDDELILAASHSNEVNMIPLFHFWGLQPSQSTIEELKVYPKSDKIYCHLKEYKKLIPLNTESFKPWYNSNYNPVGDVQQPRYDYALNNYDKDNYATKMKAQIDLIIDTYYGDDYDENCIVFSLPVNNNKVKVTNITCIGNNDGSIGLSIEDASFDYSITVTGKDDPIVITGDDKTASITGLAAGTYSVCFKVTGQEAYQQCFEVVIGEPKALSAFIDVDNDKRTTSIQLAGSKSYNIEVNGQRFEVKGDNFNTVLPTGLSIIKISTDLDCQGIIEREIFISEDIFYYPNPTKGEVDVFVNGEDTGVKMSVFTTKGDLVFTRDQNILDSRKTALDLTGVPSGTYIVTLEGTTVRKTFKIVKR